jgi:hypothetical protein
LKGEKTTSDSLTFTLASNVDRNFLIPQHAELDAVYTQSLQKLFSLFKQQKWNCVVWPTQEPSPNEIVLVKFEISLEFLLKLYIYRSERQKLVAHEIWEQARKDNKYKNNHPYTVVSGMSLFKRGSIKDIQLSSIRFALLFFGIFNLFLDCHLLEDLILYKLWNV